MTGIEELDAAIDGLIEEGVDAHRDAASIKALVRQQARLESVLSHAFGAFDKSGEWGVDGARNGPVWLARSCQVPRPQAWRLVRRGYHLRELPVVAEAFADGEINAAHVDAIVRVRTPDTEDLLESDEAMLVGQAKRLRRFEHFAKAVEYWAQQADPDGTEEAAAENRERRDVTLTPSTRHMFFGQIALDAVSGSIVAGELGRLEGEFFQADCAAARAELGRRPRLEELWRTPAQRRADALVEMAARSALVDAEGAARAPAPLFTVLVDWPTLTGRVCELAQGVVVSPGELVPWLSYADLERAVMEPDGRVEIGKKYRLFSGATRRALEVRDRECVHPFCDVPGHRCQADHIIPWFASGDTTQANGRLLCGFHNRLRHKRSPIQLE